MSILSPIRNATTPKTLIFKGGNIYNPITNSFERKDLKIQDGRIAAKERDIKPTVLDTVRVLNSNHYISPGWIDLHTHYHGCWGQGMDPIKHGLEKGVTIQVDAGSAGMFTFEDFNEHILKPTGGLVLAMMNISPGGIANRTGENMNLRHHSIEETVEAVKKYRDKVKMIKIRIGPTQDTPDTWKKTFKMAKDAARLCGIPLMVHIEDGSPLKYIFDHLDPGDIVTHAFRRDDNCNIFDENNKLKSFVLKALKRGIRLDVGHGMGGFDKGNVQSGIILLHELLSTGYYKPFSTSTDLHCFSIEKFAKSLPEVAAKMISLGMTKEDAIASITRTPAESLLLPASSWRMYAGDIANLTIWEQKISERRDHKLLDPHGKVWYTNETLVPKMVYTKGQLIDIAV